ncbi:FecR family protein [Sinomicrobium weinanense]|uniref:FecR domain-containing protein n=1 Tax=Sinomicrobium weinanense TaxID=2842200 RepID=A0A926Q2A9_9FLAO|nr:FecR domain-containing protein [Sinomicrobium weinanense]MBC9794711.1 FecR domain-containing protein [Sinomicrobium weinanense]MBU3124970.1 FecR domain-containing protein [Sinomicrobium weinanense]
MMEKKFKELLEKYLNDTCTPEEKQKVEDFFTLMQKEGHEPQEAPPDPALQDRLRKKVSGALSNTPGQEKKRRRFSIPKIAAAIAFLILSASAAFYFMKTDRYITRMADKGKQLKIVLNDSSVVYLNSGSKISYPRAFKQKIREVKLEGEAYFEIRRNEDSPFVVLSQSFKTEVLGTSFVVSNYHSGPPSVTVATGKVKVTASNKGPVYLTKNERVTLDTVLQKLIKDTVQASRYTSWTRGDIVFNQAGLLQVVATLNRRFNTDIHLGSPSYEKCTISGSYSGQSLEDILESLSFIYDIEYEVGQTGRITIFAKPCSTQK